MQVRPRVAGLPGLDPAKLALERLDGVGQGCTLAADTPQLRCCCGERHLVQVVERRHRAVRTEAARLELEPRQICRAPVDLRLQGDDVCSTLGDPAPKLLALSARWRDLVQAAEPQRIVP